MDYLRMCSHCSMYLISNNHMQCAATEKLDLTKLGHLAGWGFVMAPSYMTLWWVVVLTK